MIWFPFVVARCARLCESSAAFSCLPLAVARLYWPLSAARTCAHISPSIASGAVSSSHCCYPLHHMPPFDKVCAHFFRVLFAALMCMSVVNVTVLVLHWLLLCYAIHMQFGRGVPLDTVTHAHTHTHDGENKLHSKWQDKKKNSHIHRDHSKHHHLSVLSITVDVHFIRFMHEPASHISFASNHRTRANVFFSILIVFNFAFAQTRYSLCSTRYCCRQRLVLLLL